MFKQVLCNCLSLYASCSKLEESLQLGLEFLRELFSQDDFQEIVKTSGIIYDALHQQMFEIVKYIIKKTGVPFSTCSNKKHANKKFLEKVEKISIVMELIKTGLDPNTIENHDCITKVLEKSSNFNYEEFSILFSKLDFTAKNSKGETYLHDITRCIIHVDFGNKTSREQVSIFLLNQFKNNSQLWKELDSKGNSALFYLLFNSNFSSNFYTVLNSIFPQWYNFKLGSGPCVVVALLQFAEGNEGSILFEQVIPFADSLLIVEEKPCVLHFARSNILYYKAFPKLINHCALKNGKLYTPLSEELISGNYDKYQYKILTDLYHEFGARFPSGISIDEYFSGEGMLPIKVYNVITDENRSFPIPILKTSIIASITRWSAMTGEAISKILKCAQEHDTRKLWADALKANNIIPCIPDFRVVTSVVVCLVDQYIYKDENEKRRFSEILLQDVDDNGNNVLHSIARHEDGEQLFDCISKVCDLSALLNKENKKGETCLSLVEGEDSIVATKLYKLQQWSFAQ